MAQSFDSSLEVWWKREIEVGIICALVTSHCKSPDDLPRQFHVGDKQHGGQNLYVLQVTQETNGQGAE